MEGMDATGAKPENGTETNLADEHGDPKVAKLVEGAAGAEIESAFAASQAGGELVNHPMADSALLKDPAAAQKMAGVAALTQPDTPPAQLGAAPENGSEAAKNTPAVPVDAEVTRPTGTFESPVTLRKYRSHKVVSAAQILNVDRDVLTVDAVEGPVRVQPEPAVFSRYTPIPGDYLICYPPDGYMSLSPRDKFEDGYLPVVPDDVPAPGTVVPYEGPTPPPQPAAEQPVVLPPSHPFALAEYMQAVENLQAALLAANVTTTVVVEAGHVVAERRLALRRTLGLD